MRHAFSFPPNIRDAVREHVRRAIAEVSREPFRLDELPRRERERLVGRVRDMRRLTRSPKVIFIRELDGRREPIVASGTRIAEHAAMEFMSLSDYFVRRILTTLDGDTSPEFVAGAQDSSLKQLRVSAELRSP